LKSRHLPANPSPPSYPPRATAGSKRQLAQGREPGTSAGTVGKGRVDLRRHLPANPSPPSYPPRATAGSKRQLAQGREPGTSAGTKAELRTETPHDASPTTRRLPIARPTSPLPFPKAVAPFFGARTPHTPNAGNPSA